MWNRTVLVALFTLLVGLPTIVGAAEPQTVRLWPDRAPGETQSLGPEKNITTEKDNRPGGLPVVRIAPVSDPTITIYPAAPAKRNGAAVLVCPGGAYVRLAVDVEGSEICEWLNSLGVTGVLLKYRVPRRPGVPQYIPPLQDAQRAMGWLRTHAQEWDLDVHRVGAIGFSAGADLVAHLSNQHARRVYSPVDPADDASCRPDFAMLIYPGYLVNDKNIMADGLDVSATNTPPTFLVQAEDDFARVENSLLYYTALKKAKVPAEMHLYPVGGHGYGMRRTGATVATWPDRAADWMRAAGWLVPAP